MVRERREVDVILHVDRERRGERLRRIAPAFPLERLGTDAEIGVEQCVEAPLPGGRERLLAILRGCHDGVEIGFQHAREFVEIGFVRAVVEAGVDVVRHDAVGLDALRHVARGAAFGEVDRAVHAHVFFGLVHERVAHDPHLREVHFAAAAPQDLAFEHRHGRVAPARAAAVLILHGGRAQDVPVGEPVSFGFAVGFGGLRSGGEYRAEHQQSKEVFHKRVVCLRLSVRCGRGGSGCAGYRLAAKSLPGSGSRGGSSPPRHALRVVISSRWRRSSGTPRGSAPRAWRPWAAGSFSPCRRCRRRSGRSSRACPDPRRSA